MAFLSTSRVSVLANSRHSSACFLNSATVRMNTAYSLDTRNQRQLRRDHELCMVLSQRELLRAMFDVGYFPPNTPPDQSNIAVLPSPKNAVSGVQPWTILQ
jgi:hypothetical protein